VPPASSLSPSQAPPQGTSKDNFVPAYVALVHPIASNIEQPYARTYLGLNLIYGRAGELDNGVQLGLVNVVSGKSNVASGKMTGLQLAPLGANYVSGAVSGGQWAFVGNVAGANVDGAQLSLGVNVAAEGVKGAQVGAVNVAGDVTGTQIGWINVGRKVRGVTVGLINVADDIEGVPVGLVSVTRTGGVHPVVWSSNAAYANAGLKFSTKYTYTTVAAHYVNDAARTYDDSPPIRVDQRDFVGAGVFLGGRVPGDRAYLEFDVGVAGLPAVSQSEFTSSTVASTSSSAAQGTRRYLQFLVDSRLRLLGGYRFADHFSAFVGVGGVLRARFVDEADRAALRVHPEVSVGVQL